ERVDRTDEAAAVQVDDRARRRPAATGHRVRREAVGQVLAHHGVAPAEPRHRTGGEGPVERRVPPHQPLSLRGRRAELPGPAQSRHGVREELVAATGHAPNLPPPGLSQIRGGRCLVGMTSTSTFRIPKAEITGAYGALMKFFAQRMLGGEFPDNGYV